MLALVNPCHGKIGRIHWWLSQIAIFCLAIGGLVATFHFSTGGVGLAVLVIMIMYMNLCTCLNRLRDSSRPGILYLSFFLPSIGTALMFYFCGIEKSPGRFRSDRSHLPEDCFVPAAPPPVRPAPQPRAPSPPPKEFGRRNRSAV